MPIVGISGLFSTELRGKGWLPAPFPSAPMPLATLDLEDGTPLLLEDGTPLLLEDAQV
jgi:hypothetical protein